MTATAPGPTVVEVPAPNVQHVLNAMLQLASQHVYELSALAQRYRAPGFTEALDAAACAYAGQILDLLELS